MCRSRFILAVVLSVPDRSGSGLFLAAIIVRTRENLGIKKDGITPSKMGSKIFLKNFQKGVDKWDAPCYHNAISKAQPPTIGGEGVAGDLKSKTRWEAENVVRLTIKINRNRDPKLFELLQQSESKAQTVRELLRRAIAEK